MLAEHTRLFSSVSDARAESSAPGSPDEPASEMSGAEMQGIGAGVCEEIGSERCDVRGEGDVCSEKSGTQETQESASAELTGASDAFGNEREIDGACAFADDAEDETQLAAIRELMTRAAASGVWLTLAEIAEATEFAEASISAQLRHLRKAQNGGHRVEKRHRRMPSAIARMRKAGEARRGPVIWEYRVLSACASSIVRPSGQAGTGAGRIRPEAGQADAGVAEEPNAETCNRF